MTRSERERTAIVRTWLEDGSTELSTRVLDAVLRDMPTTTQDRPFWSRWTRMTTFARFAAATATVLALVAVGVQLTATPGAPGPGTTPSESPMPSILPALNLPGSRGGPAGDYGWTGGAGSIGWLHRVVGDADNSRQTQIAFAIENDCFAAGEGPEPRPLTIAGFDALHVEPYQDTDLPFLDSVSGENSISAYALVVDGRTLCVYTAWGDSSTPADLSALREVLETIRGHAWGEGGIRINFTLEAGWDTG